MVIIGLLFTPILVAATVRTFLLKQDESRFTRREGQAVFLAAMLIVMSSLVERFITEIADDLLIVGGIIAPVLVAAVARRRFLWYGFFTVVAGVLFRILADCKFQLSAFSDTTGILGRYGFAAVALCGIALITSNYLKQYVTKKES